MNRIIQLLNCRYPIIQGTMAYLSTPQLVAAVSNAGGFGVLSTAFADAQQLQKDIRQTKNMTDKPFGVNLMVSNPRSIDLIDVLTEERIWAVTTSAGNPEQLAKLLKERGIRVLHVVPNSQAALKAEQAGVDAVIAEGGESGGTLSPNDVSTIALIPVVVDKVKIPVVAAGGISDGRGFAAMLMLGAEGIQMGTRFIASAECIAHPSYKNAILAARETDTLKVYAGPAPVRVLRTPLSEKLNRSRNPNVTEKEVGDALGLAGVSFLEGRIDQGPFLSGQGCGIIEEVLPVKDIIDSIIKQAGVIIENMHANFPFH